MRRLLVAQEAAELMRVSRRHFAERISHRPDFPAPANTGGWRRWWSDDIENYLEGRLAKARTNSASKANN